MEQSKKKPVMVGVIVACLVLAGVVTYITKSGGSGTAIGEAGEMMWVKCRNPQCAAEYQMALEDYYDYQQANATDLSLAPLICEKCSEKSSFRAVKCPECDVVFFYGSTTGDYDDRCPDCDYSQVEVDRKGSQE